MGGIGKSVLVVEDEAAIREVMCEVLRGRGYDVAAAADGYEALRVLAERPRVDVLVTDIRMPGLNGFRLARQAKVMQPDLRVVYVSGYVDPAALHDAQDSLGEILRKPYRPHQLAAAVRAALGVTT